jgi:hypothetical protein
MNERVMLQDNLFLYTVSSLTTAFKSIRETESRVAFIYSYPVFCLYVSINAGTQNSGRVTILPKYEACPP